MKKYLVIFIIALCCCIIACSKSNDAILIRVQNATLLDFKEVIANNKSFENVESNEITSCKAFESALDVPAATIITTGNDTIVAGDLYYDYMILLKMANTR